MLAEPTFDMSEPTEAPRERFQAAAAERQGGADVPEEELWEGSYSHLAMIGSWIAGGVMTIAVIVLGLLANAPGSGWLWILVGIGVMWLSMAAWYGYRRLSVRYRLSTQRFVEESGLLWRTVDRVELIDVDDITYRQGPVERMLGVGTIVMISSDRTSPELELPGIFPVREVADMIDDARRAERRSRGLHIESV